MKTRVRQRANRRLKHSEEKVVKCDLHNCAGNKSGCCRILKSNHFGDKVCPFYKTAEQNEKEQKAVMARLIAMDRQDLIELYYGEKAGVGNGC
jgi:hypothetical protein